MMVNCGKPTFGFIQAILGAQFVDKITKHPKKTTTTTTSQHIK